MFAESVKCRRRFQGNVVYIAASKAPSHRRSLPSDGPDIGSIKRFD
jgi:hypothetical protein